MTGQSGGRQVGANTPDAGVVILIADALVPTLFLCLAQALPVHGTTVERSHITCTKAGILASLGQGEDRPSLDVGIDEAVGIVHEH